MGLIKSRTSPWVPAAGPSARGGSVAVVIGPVRLNLGRCATHMGTWPDIFWTYQTLTLWAGEAPSGSGGPWRLNGLGKLYQTKVVEYP